VHGAGLDHSLFGLQSRYFATTAGTCWRSTFPATGFRRTAASDHRSNGALVLEVLKHLKIQKPSVIGHSMAL